MILLGLDPGIADTGYGVIASERGSLSCLAYGSIKTSSKLALPERLEILFTDLTALIKQFQPKLVAIEELFFAKNVKTALTVGQARGVLLLACQQAKLEIGSFTPLQVKQAVAAYGGADKQQVQRMVQLLLNLKEIPKPDDAADALAIAIAASGNLKFR